MEFQKDFEHSEKKEQKKIKLKDLRQQNFESNDLDQLHVDFNCFIDITVLNGTLINVLASSFG